MEQPNVHNVSAVSYTHLDVYKRQTFITGFNGSGYSDGTFFLYCLFVRNGGANKDLSLIHI